LENIQSSLLIVPPFPLSCQPFSVRNFFGIVERENHKRHPIETRSQNHFPPGAPASHGPGTSTKKRSEQTPAPRSHLVTESKNAPFPPTSPSSPAAALLPQRPQAASAQGRLVLGTVLCRTVQCLSTGQRGQLARRTAPVPSSPTRCPSPCNPGRPSFQVGPSPFPSSPQPQRTKPPVTPTRGLPHNTKKRHSHIITFHASRFNPLSSGAIFVTGGGRNWPT
jgi:hypothetical protein